MSLLEIFGWIQYSPLLVAMRRVPWLFPIIASIHLMGLAVIGGAVLVGDLRLLGFGLSRSLWRWLHETPSGGSLWAFW